MLYSSRQLPVFQRDVQFPSSGFPEGWWRHFPSHSFTKQICLVVVSTLDVSLSGARFKSELRHWLYWLSFLWPWQPNARIVWSQLRWCGVCGGQSGSSELFFKVSPANFPSTAAPYSLIILSSVLYCPDSDSIANDQLSDEKPLNQGTWCHGTDDHSCCCANLRSCCLVCSMACHDWWATWGVRQWPSLTSECDWSQRFSVTSGLLKCTPGRNALPKPYCVSLIYFDLFNSLRPCSIQWYTD